jgi:CRISPR/Cas system-associated endoribonuclease Cas2
MPDAQLEHPAATGTPHPAWLLLVYRIPSEPSRLRATVWRRLKSHGAIYLQNSVAALPASASAERALRRLRAEIGELGGTASLLRAETLAGGADILSAYNAARDDEYEEIVDKCRDFLAEIAKETADTHFTYAELEENEEDLAKLRRWLEKITTRDTLAATGAADAATAVEQCVTALEEFAHHVYAADDDGA